MQRNSSNVAQSLSDINRNPKQSYIDLQTRANSAIDKYMTLTFDLLTSGSIFALSTKFGVDSSSCFLF